MCQFLNQGKIMNKKYLTAFLFFVISSNAYSTDNYFLITHGSQDPYWASLFLGAKAAADDFHIHLQILAPSGANDIPKQVQYLNSAIATHPAGIATTIPSETAFSTSLVNAKTNDIPVVAFDTKPDNLQKNPFLAYLGTDNQSLGRNLALHALEIDKIKGRAVILNPQPGHVGLEARAKGIKEVLASKNIVVDELDVGTDAETVQAHIKSYFIRNPTTSTIFCLTSQALDPLGEILLHPTQNHFLTRPRIYTFDKTSNTLNLMNQGLVNYAMDQQPFLMGYESIAELVLLNKYKINPVDINTAGR